MTKIPIKEIIIIEVESLNSGLKHVFSTYEEAEAFARSIASEREEYEKSNGWEVGKNGYFKTDFCVVFEDGEEYEGRLDIKPLSCDDNDTNIRRHICDFVRFYGGYATKETLYDHISWDGYLVMLRQISFKSLLEYRNFYEKYEIGQDEVKQI